MKSQNEPLYTTTKNHMKSIARHQIFSYNLRKGKKNIPDMPALRQPEIVSTDRDLGPNVPTIFVIAEKKLCNNHKQ